MIITIDGPAGTGKSTVARKVADRLGFDFLDTGAMYRAVALEVLRRNADLHNPRELGHVAKFCRISFDWSARPPTVRLNAEPVGHLLRGSEVTSASSHVAAVPAVRQQMVCEQRRIAEEHGNLVTEGRDQGTVVFPDAGLKIYLDARPEERARRRVAQLRARGEIAQIDQVLREIEDRDDRDRNRPVGPLTVPAGAHTIDTTDLTEDEVVDRICRYAGATCASADAAPADGAPAAGAPASGGGVAV